MVLLQKLASKVFVIMDETLLWLVLVLRVVNNTLVIAHISRITTFA